MDIILIPGLWLGADSWAEVTPTLEQAGHRVLPLTMPGVGLAAAHSSTIGIAEWVATGVAAVDALPGEVVIVGHSGGGNVAWGVVDARADRIARAIFVDAVPPPPNTGINEFAVHDGVIPFPGWEFFPDEDVHDLDAETRARTAPLTRSVPARVPTDPLPLTHPERHRVPVTLLMGGLDQASFETEIAQWGAYAVEYRSIEDAEVVLIGSAHWPQFSVPTRLAELILTAVER